MLRGMFTAVLLAASFAQAGTAHLHQAIGDPARRDREVEVELDRLIDAHGGGALGYEQLAERLAGTRMLFIGESHTDVSSHRLQLRVIRALHEAGRRVVIGLEMYPYTAQPHLDRWIAGEYDERGFVAASDWYENWGYHWNYYRDIFLYARDNGLPMRAINAPRDVVTAVREKGFEGLSEEERRHVPPEVDTGSAEHRQLFKSYFDEDDPMHGAMTEEQWDGMVRAQATWDATMGWQALRGLHEVAGDDDGGRTIVVVLIGSGHVAYGLGIERQVRQWFDGGTASLIAVHVEDEEGEPIEKVQASYADGIIGVPFPGELYPRLGVSTKKAADDRREVIHVMEESPAAAAGVQVGDVLLALNGAAIASRGDLNRLQAALEWGDTVRLTLLRGETEQTVEVTFRRD